MRDPIPFPLPLRAPGPAPGDPLADQEARHRIENELDTTFFVEAAAGTGKTTALVGRMMSVLRSGTGTLESMVAVTFTEKAAGEMKLRLRSEIEKARKAEPEPAEAERLEEALRQLEEARIGTIHAFCADLLHERPVEAGVDPLFEVASQDVAERLLDEAFDDWFGQILADPPEGVRRVLRRKASGSFGDGPRRQLRRAASSLVEHRDFDASWRREDLDRARAIDGVLGDLRPLGALAVHAPRPDDYLGQNLAEVARFVDDVDRLEAVQPRDYDALEAGLRSLRRHRGWKWRGYGEGFGPLSRSEAISRRDAAFARLTDVTEALDADLAPLLREELRGVVGRYEAVKARDGRLDFLDLLIRARDLVRDRPMVRHQLQSQFTHYFIDELQDTDPLQLELLLLLAADEPAESNYLSVRPRPGKLFVVGDPKQSIYRFRRADVAVYEAAKARLEKVGAIVLHLTTSFRSVPGIQAAVNAAFAPVMTARPDGSQAAYVALDPHRPEPLDRPSVIALPVPAPYSDYGTVTQWAVEQSLPQAVGAFVSWLTKESGWTVEEDGQQVAVKPHHICLLLRRLQSRGADITRPYVAALEARRVPHLLVGGRSFHDREEVLALRNALAAIEWPEDALRVFATLKGPLFAFNDDTLLAYKSRGAPLHPLAPQDLPDLPPDEADIAAALKILAALHWARNRRPIADTLDDLLGSVRAHASVALWPNGEQALANMLRVADRARRFEADGAASFRAFVERLEDEAEGGSVEEAPIVEEGAEGVRLMTVHKAKGLEFPIVILVDPTYGSAPHDPSHYLDTNLRLWAEPLCGSIPPDLLERREHELARDAAEAHRIAYVAATRARDLLVIPVVGDERTSGWLDVLNPALYPPPAARRGAQQGPGCPAFGADSVKFRPHKAKAGRDSSVAPGRHQSEAQTDVVWWDPNVLDLDHDHDIGLRLESVLKADAERSGVADGSQAHEDWSSSRSRTLSAGGVPERTVYAAAAFAEVVTQVLAGSMALPEAVDPAAVEVLHARITPESRPHGRRFGQLVHEILAKVDLAADAATVQRVAAAVARRIGAAQEELDAAAGAVNTVLAHPILVAAAALDPSQIQREVPVLFPLEGHKGPFLVEGIVDLAYRLAERGAAEWTVVDFKTDVELSHAEPAYRLQVALYAAAVRAATGEPARAVLLVL